MIKLKYGNTNTFYINGLLVDTDYAGTLSAFYRALKADAIALKDIKYVMATHYHPDHMGLISELAGKGVKHLLIGVQKELVHFSDSIFKSDGLRYFPIDESKAQVISCEGSRKFLASLGISGEIISTPSHSPDSISLILDDGECIVGDLEPFEYIEAYENNEALKKDWERIMSYHPKRVYFAHAPERTFRGGL